MGSFLPHDCALAFSDVQLPSPASVEVAPVRRALVKLAEAPCGTVLDGAPRIARRYGLQGRDHRLYHTPSGSTTEDRRNILT